MATTAAAIAGAKIAAKVIDKATEDNQPVDEFFSNQIKQQSIQSNTGWNTLMQALVTRISKEVLEGENSVDMEAIEKLMSLTKSVQLDNIEIMKEVIK